MNREELDQLRATVTEVTAWSRHAALIIADRANVQTGSDDAFTRLRQSIVGVDRKGERQWNVLPLGQSRAADLGLVARATQLPQLAASEEHALNALYTSVPDALLKVRSLLGVRRIFSGGKAKDEGAASARYLAEFRSWGHSVGVPQSLVRIDDSVRGHSSVQPFSALEPWVGFSARLSKTPLSLLPGAAVAGLSAAVDLINRTLTLEDDNRRRAVDAGTALRRAETDRLVADMPIDRLKDATRERIRTNLLSQAGLRTVQDVFTYSSHLEAIPGIGATSAHRIKGAARAIWQATFEEMPVRIDIQNPSAETRKLVEQLRSWDATRKTKNATADLAHAAALTPLAKALPSDLASLVVMDAGSDHADFIAAVEAVKNRAGLIGGLAPQRGSATAWDDFLARPADYFAMLHELGFLVEDEDAVAGGLPEEIVEAVRGFELDASHLTASLRGYQSFGARFALVQRKVIIGDEMGLGKTVEALAVFAHLRAKGAHHGIVVCPAAVVTNWMREIQSKSTLRAHRLHGVGRDGELRSWVRNGGIAVTTYESLAWLEARQASVEELACVVFDEAHYIKNPGALRSARSKALIESAERAVLLSGTPLENRVEEFRNLVSYLRPDLIVDATDLRPRLFRQQVAPAYLRRNQEDVLTELPDLVEVDEWLPMSSTDSSRYRDAVYAGNFQAMRQATMLTGRDSEKIARLTEIVREAEDNDRKVIVFSNFLNVLDAVTAALPGRVFGPLTGGVPAAKRQNLVDEFSAAQGGAVLVAQILAGGVGLNIQAASVVVICEPQLKPTTEWQAIARAHRMGQLQSVQVHRLLSEEGVDARVTQILARKKALFADFAAVSETAAAAPEAFDVSEAELVREVLEAERQRLFPGIPALDERVG
ncbi:DEAD/DEAH box helicase [Agromyces protaetiae]|uniref:DEAD/DEAH box helicase n=1 Tax=Agromyces protaetiae TaxID=2509455 RepID=A0A4P6FCB2_9MICO|nr:DEAD/DEAH box helicase [Agromyces protaetiae]QAY72583.1 DEAD/DEAH box helicase [Agromyces protaetiae]